MTDLEKLQKQDEKNKATIEKLIAKSEELEAVILQDPDNYKTALEAAGIDKQIQAAYKARQRTLQAIEAEKERIAQVEKDQAQKQMIELREKADSIREKQIAKLMDFYEVYDEWEQICKRHLSLASNYKLPGPNLMNLDDTQVGMRAIKHQLDQWQGRRKYMEHMARAAARMAENTKNK